VGGSFVFLSGHARQRVRPRQRRRASPCTSLPLRSPCHVTRSSQPPRLWSPGDRTSRSWRADQERSAPLQRRDVSHSHVIRGLPPAKFSGSPLHRVRAHHERTDKGGFWSAHSPSNAGTKATATSSEEVRQSPSSNTAWASTPSSLGANLT